ncbi:Kinesin motor domain containing protein [Trichomonas vaginalis G3]|uniref:Kinesin motor domain containing protein n=1 Tax=Trichomonas vaginalis (strain ATCC PRA-98 / G3) TaxID=412133 RepID=A2G8A7_TRIV3|nr:microtubule motor protein [Trichomonas vaginalis G3]EAX86606.1 Kinesin motor domain containing protein [Trichomonas vaginalis G3]KAI5539896.1 microtubule motor protein [Trichomonas vaginalis G3]|eukprot:XP_001299536.1 Kinesin motor domain containing protein [Trichomonas vaginalis G3]
MNPNHAVSTVKKSPKKENSKDQTPNNEMNLTQYEDDKIKVYLRVRPLINDESPMDLTLDDNTITIRPPNHKNSSYFCVDKSFKFRGILNSHANQEQVFDMVAKDLLDNFINGSDVHIFCYGSTNAGKTYTINGNEDDPGLLFRVLNQIVPPIIENERENAKLYASFNEIYNERIYDLLSDKKESLSIGFNVMGDTEIKGCIEIPIITVEDIQLVVQKGIEARHKGSTDFNLDSSRSHSIFRLKLATLLGYSWLSIVDLAGSERLSVMNSAVGSFKEACNINKGMLVLGKCIRCLKEQGKTTTKIPIPYRESKLTHIFKNLFEPMKRQAKAAIIINISPNVTQIEDTIFSLQFAAEASECSIRQVSRPQDISGTDDPNAQFLRESSTVLFFDNSPDILERRLRLEIGKTVEEALLQQKMQYEYLLQQMTQLSTYNPSKENLIREKPEIIKSYLSKLQAFLDQNKELEFQIQKMSLDGQKLQQSKDKIQTEYKDIEGEIEKLKSQLETMSDFL